MSELFAMAVLICRGGMAHVPDRSIDRGQTAHEREKVIRKVRRQLKRNRGPKRARDRSWTRYAPEVYEELAAQGVSILSIHVTAKTSGVWQSASLARSMLPEADIEVIDSASISMGTGFIILEAAKAIEAGRSKGEVLALIEDIKSRMNIYATVGTLKYLRLSGRVGHMREIFASFLDIKPIITVEDGVVEAIDKVRTRKKALDRVIELTKQEVGTEGPVNAAVMHTAVEEEALEFKERVRKNSNCQELFFGEAGIALGVNAGPGVLGIVAYRVDQ